MAAAATLTGVAEAAGPFATPIKRPESSPPGEPPPPPAPVVGPDYFTFRLCNRSRVDIAAAIARLMGVNDSRYMVSGWFIVDRGKCEDLGPFPKGWFYFYGEKRNAGNELYWGANDLKLCVEYPGPFDRINTEGYTCNKDRLKGFYSHQVKPGENLYTFNMNP